MKEKSPSLQSLIFVSFIIVASFFAVTQAELRAYESIRVGVFPNKPIVYFEDGPKGLFVEILNQIAEKEAWQIEYVPCELKDCFTLLKSNELDLMTCLGKSPERLQVLTYSKEPVWTFWGTIYSRDQTIQSVLDLKDKKIGVRRKNKITLELRKLLNEFKISVQYVEFDNYESAYQAFRNRKIDTLAVNNTYAFGKQKEINIHKTPLVFTPFSAYFASLKNGRHQDKLAVIDDYIKTFKEDKFSLMHRFEEKWFGYTETYWTLRRIGIISAIFLVITICLMAWWRYRSIVNINIELNKYRDHLEELVNERTLELSDVNQALTDSENKFRSLSDASFEGIIISDKGKILEVNNTIANILGYPAAELKKMTTVDLVSPEDREQVQNNILSGYEEPYEIHGLTKEGVSFPIEAHARMFSYKGRQVRVTAIRDISERKKAEEALRQSEKQLHTLIQSIQVGVVVHSPDTKIIHCNKASQELLGLTEDQMIGKEAIDSAWKFCNEDGSDMRIDDYPVNQVIKSTNGLANLVIGINKPKETDISWTLVNAVPDIDFDGNIIRVIVTFIDITERKQAEQNAYESKQLLQTLIDTIEGEVFAKDLNGKYLLINNAFEKDFGVNRNDVIGKDDFYVFPSEVAEKLQENDKRIMASKVAETALESGEMRGKSGTYITNKVPFINDNGNVYGICGVGFDISEQKKLEEALRQSENKLKNIFNSSIPICITNTDYQIILSNDAYKNIFNLNEQSGSPVKCYESRPGPICGTDACPMKRVLSGEKEVVCEPTKAYENGTKQYFIVTARPFLDDKGEVSGIVESFQDITDRKNAEIERDNLIRELQTAISEIKTLRGILPICSFCKNIRNDEGYYEQIESYIHKHSGVDFSHTICPDCAKKHYPELFDENGNLCSSKT